MPASVHPHNPKTEDLAERWFVVREIPDHWPISRAEAYGSVRRGELRAARLGVGRRKIAIKGAWIAEYLERRSTPVELPR